MHATTLIGAANLQFVPIVVVAHLAGMGPCSNVEHCMHMDVEPRMNFLMVLMAASSIHYEGSANAKVVEVCCWLEMRRRETDDFLDAIEVTPSNMCTSAQLHQCGMSNAQRATIRFVAALKPMHDVEPDNANVRELVCKETQPIGCATILRAALEHRRAIGATLDKLKFIDLGSGLGQVPLLMHILSNGSVSTVSGVEVRPDLHALTEQWCHEMLRTCPWLQLAIEHFLEHQLLASLREPSAMLTNLV